MTWFPNKANGFFLLREARRRAKAKGIAFTLTERDIPIPEFCPVLGIPLFRGKGFPGDNSPTLDRINNSLGYTPGNVKVISYKANMLKGDATLDELRQIVKYMEAFEHNPMFDRVYEARVCQAG